MPPRSWPAVDDVGAQIEANRREINAKLDEIAQALAGTELTAYEVVPLVFPEFEPSMMGSALTIIVCFLTHLDRCRLTPSRGWKNRPVPLLAAPRGSP